MDHSHSDWILGGMFKEIARASHYYQNNLIEISNLRNKSAIKSFVKVVLLCFSKSPLLFTSITPLQNFVKFNPTQVNFKALWYTHSELKISQKDVKLLNKVDVIFCHSRNDKIELVKCGVKSPIHNIIGGIDPDRFPRLATPGNKISWVGTTAVRKNPRLFLDFVRANPKLKFRLLGRNWNSSSLFEEMYQLKNLEFKKIIGALTSKDFDGCSHYLCLSQIEGGPMPLLESVAAGLIPISTNVGFAQELLTEFGYNRQILKHPIKFEDIIKKFNYSYNTQHRKNASLLAKKYSLASFSNKIQNNIEISIGMKP